MSGTSADGVDVALCRVGPGRTPADSPRLSLLGLLSFPYPRPVREQILRVMGGGASSAAELSRLNWRLGQIYADCVQRTADKFRTKVNLVGCHGQTVHHETHRISYLGAPTRSTSQIGEASVIAERMRCPVVSDFRPADLAAGGQGAPLVPMLDWSLFRSPKLSRVLQNLGGIGNLTAIAAGSASDQVIAFDTGPGNMVIDQCMARLFGKKLDRNGAVARRGKVLNQVVQQILQQPYFAAAPPKSCGREEFGAPFSETFIASCRKLGASDADCVATATALTAESVLLAYRQFVWGHVGRLAPLAPVEFCVAGGGARNATLMRMLSEGLSELGVRVRASEDLGMPPQAKEAAAFALLAWLSWHCRVGNIPTATGARRPVVLGKVSLPG